MKCTFIPCVSAQAAWVLGHIFGTTQDHARRQPSDICMALGPFDKVQKMFPASQVISFQNFVLRTNLSGQVEALIDWDKIDAVHASNSHKKKSNTSIGHVLSPISAERVFNRMKPIKAPKRSIVENHDCIVCFAYPAHWRWSNCFHSHEGGALICRTCRNLMLDAEVLTDNPYDRHTILTHCVICRKAGFMVQHVFEDQQMHR